MAPVITGIVLGLIGPLLATTTSWLAVDRAYRRDPAGTTPIMIRALAAKAAFFVGYVTVVLQGFGVSPLPFVVSFTACFISLYAAQAYLLHRLLSRAWRGAR